MKAKERKGATKATGREFRPKDKFGSPALQGHTYETLMKTENGETKRREKGRNKLTVIGSLGITLNLSYTYRCHPRRKRNVGGAFFQKIDQISGQRHMHMWLAAGQHGSSHWQKYRYQYRITSC
jgi:hypothetical protein